MIKFKKCIIFMRIMQFYPDKNNKKLQMIQKKQSINRFNMYLT